MSQHMSCLVLGKKDFVMHGFEPVVHICAAGVVQFNWQSG